jgi:tRNA(His) 5'-end guanylyltransferase
MNDKIIQDSVIRETPYYEKLYATYRDSANFARYFTILKRITRRDPLIEKLEHNQGKELVYLGRRIFTLQDDFVANYLKFLEDESHIDAWESFFEQWSISCSITSGIR